MKTSMYLKNAWGVFAKVLRFSGIFFLKRYLGRIRARLSQKIIFD
jgi:hypothetical protein